LDDGSAEAYDALGVLNWRFEWDWDAADRAFSRAIELAPSYSCAHEDRAMFLAFAGRRAEALAEVTKVQQLDYSSVSAGVESYVYYALRDYPALIEASKRGLLLNPTDWGQHYSLGVGYEGTGQIQEAISEYQRAMQLSNGSPKPAIALAHAYSVGGKKDEARQLLQGLQRKSRETFLPPYTEATICAGLGQNDKAFEFLEAAFAQKAFDISVSLKSDLVLDGLRPDPRFQSLLRRMRLIA
jgi:tetratricopeptide (TPR) repeat protein